MKARLTIDFADLTEMLDFTNRIGDNSAGTSLATVLERVNQMANTQIADFIASTRGSLDTLNAEQARVVAALDRVLAQRDEMLAALADMPRRIQDAVDAAMAEGVEEGQIAALTALGAAVAGEVDEARAEADRLEAIAPAATPTPPAGPVDEVPPTDGGVVPPTDGTVPDGGSDTTGGGTPVPTPGA